MFKSKMLIVALTLALVVAAFFGSNTASAAPGNRIVVRISADKTSFTGGESALVNVTFKNSGRRNAQTLGWFTPYEDVTESLFSITRDGQPVAYLGPDYKRGAVSVSDYVTLRPGESFTRTIDLGQYYDLSVSGTYSIRYDVASKNLFSEKGNMFRNEGLSSNKLNLAIEGRAKFSLPAISPDSVTGLNSFNRCNGNQKSALSSARDQASVYAAEALSYMNAGVAGARFTTWFGVYDSLRFATARNHFDAISQAMDTAPIKFDCSCKQKNAYSYVYDTQPYDIYICPLFWNSPLAGTDSQGGALVHEMSHFNVVASTDDWAYGQGGAQNLAITDPNKALFNADTHEYFAENNPYQQ